MSTPFALNHALAYATLGWSVIPIKPDKKIPPIKWKPYQTKAPTQDQLKTWFTKWPKCNVGIITGTGSDLCSLDFDSTEAIEAFRHTIGDIPDSLRFKTGKGMQVLFRFPANEILKNQAGIMENVDFRGQGGLIVVPPSVHSSGKIYDWIDIDPLEMGIDDLLEVPSHILAFLKNGQEDTKTTQEWTQSKKQPLPPFKPKKDPAWIQEALMGVKSGKRNHVGARVAGYFFNLFDHEENCMELTLQNTLNWNLNNEPPMSQAEVKVIVNSIAQRHGTQKLSHVIQKKIHAVQKLNYPDGDVRYNFYFDVHDQAVHLRAEELISSMKFRTRMMQATDKIIRPIKNEIFWPIIEQVLAEAQHIIMREDETKISTIRDFIQDDINKEHKYKNVEVFLKKHALEHSDYIYVTMNAIADRLRFSTIKMGSNKELGNLLRKIGFKPSTKFKKVRTWRISTKGFDKLEEMIDEE